MLSHFINVQYCYDYLVNQIPMGLLLYSHLPVALAALVFSIYVLIKARSFSSLLLFCTCFTFTVWSVFDLSAWFSFLGSANTMFVWSLLDFLAVLMFFFGYYFIYTFVKEDDLPLWQKIASLLVLAPTAYISFSGLNIPTYDLNSCVAIEDRSLTIYTYYAEAIFILATIVFMVYQYSYNKERVFKRKVILAGIGIMSFFSVFFSASFLVSLLAETDASSYVYNYLIYGLFGMPIFLIYLGYLIVKYRVFDLRIFTAQALSIATITIVAAQFAFLKSLSNIILNLINLLLVSLVSIYLAKNVKKEISQREQIEKLAKELEGANIKLRELDQMKSEFLSLATHQIRAPLTAIKGYSSMLLEGDFGQLPRKASESALVIMKSCQDLINIVNDFLNISRIEQGRMVYEKTNFDLGELATETVEENKPNVKKAGLSISVEIPSKEKYTVNADRDKVKQAIGNIVDNAIKYTLHGGITVSAIAKSGRAIIEVRDTGIGINPEEISKLFNKFSRSKDANKTNVRGTGLGLYIAKKMIADMGGDIKAYSEGEGKGTKFTIELPKI